MQISVSKPPVVYIDNGKSQKSVEQEGGYKEKISTSKQERNALKSAYKHNKEREYDVISSVSKRGRLGRSKSKNKQVRDLDDYMEAEGGEQIIQSRKSKLERLDSKKSLKSGGDIDTQNTDRALL